jgi:hypothetical protein
MKAQKDELECKLRETELELGACKKKLNELEMNNAGKLAF